MGDGFVVGGVDFFVSAQDAGIFVGGQILDGSTAVRTTPLLLGDVIIVLGGEPLVGTGQMERTMAAFGQANDFIGLGVPFVQADDARHDFCVRGVVALESDDDRFRAGGSCRWNHSI